MDEKKKPHELTASQSYFKDLRKGNHVWSNVPIPGSSEVNVAQLLMNKLLEVEGILQDARDAIGHSFPAALSVEDDKWMSVELRALSHRVSDLIENIVEIERGKK